jgi:hypothetical protein
VDSVPGIKDVVNLVVTGGKALLKHAKLRAGKRLPRSLSSKPTSNPSNPVEA